MNGTLREFGRFAIVGAAGLVVDVIVLYIALAAGFGFFAGRLVSFLAAVWVTWQINRRYTFVAARAGLPVLAWTEWFRYLLAMLGGGAVNYAAYSAMIVFAHRVPFLPLTSVCVGSLAGMAVNFIGAKFFVFKR
jgi:putative flippase GtrA